MKATKRFQVYQYYCEGVFVHTLFGKLFGKLCECPCYLEILNEKLILNHGNALLDSDRNNSSMLAKQGLLKRNWQEKSPWNYQTYEMFASSFSFQHCLD